MARTDAEILHLLRARKAERGEAANRMSRIADHYNNDLVVPLPELDKAEEPFTPNFFASGIDQHGMRVGSVMPVLSYPVLKPGVNASMEASRMRRLANYSWWQRTDMKLVLRKRARHLIGYASSPVYIRPDPENGNCPTWEPRSPLSCYPADSSDGHPDNAIFTYTRTIAWLNARYPGLAVQLKNVGVGRLEPTDRIEVCDYVSAEERVLLATGNYGTLTHGVPTDWTTLEPLRVEAEYGVKDAVITTIGGGTPNTAKTWATRLDYAPNLAGCSPVFTPDRISMELAKGQFDDALGLFQMFAKMMSLDVHAVANSVFPDLWFLHGPQGGKIIRTADGRKGIIGEVEGGTLDAIQLQPGFQTGQTLDRLERAIRINTAIPAELTGEAATGIRTGRRGGQVLSEAIDFYVQEHQELLQSSLEKECEVAAEIDRAYNGSRKVSFYVNYNQAKGMTNYIPAELWAGPHPVRVTYPNAGMDAQSQIIFAGQQMATELVSKHTTRRQMPNIDDPEFEETQIDKEALNVAVRAAIQAQANAGALSLDDVARVDELLDENPGMKLTAAVRKVQKEAQERQAMITPEGAPATAPPGSPEAQPGLAAPGIGAEVPETVQPGPASSHNLANALSDLLRGRSLTQGAA